MATSPLREKTSVLTKGLSYSDAPCRIANEFRFSSFDFWLYYCFGFAASCFILSSVQGGTIPICRAYAIDWPRCSP
jgi:hypothetical protein